MSERQKQSGGDNIVKKEPYRDYVTECFRQYGAAMGRPLASVGFVELQNLLAASRTMDALSPEAKDAVAAVYIHDAKKHMGRGEIKRRVTMHALKTFHSEESVYRALRAARDICAEERGLKEKS